MFGLLDIPPAPAMLPSVVSVIANHHPFFKINMVTDPSGERVVEITAMVPSSDECQNHRRSCGLHGSDLVLRERMRLLQYEDGVEINERDEPTFSLRIVMMKPLGRCHPIRYRCRQGVAAGKAPWFRTEAQLFEDVLLDIDRLRSQNVRTYFWVKSHNSTTSIHNFGLIRKEVIRVMHSVRTVSRMERIDDTV